MSLNFDVQYKLHDLQLRLLINSQNKYTAAAKMLTEESLSLKSWSWFFHFILKRIDYALNHGGQGSIWKLLSSAIYQCESNRFVDMEVIYNLMYLDIFISIIFTPFNPDRFT